jgi:hypothetical protein
MLILRFFFFSVQVKDISFKQSCCCTCCGAIHIIASDKTHPDLVSAQPLTVASSNLLFLTI